MGWTLHGIFLVAFISHITKSFGELAQKRYNMTIVSSCGKRYNNALTKDEETPIFLDLGKFIEYNDVTGKRCASPLLGTVRIMFETASDLTSSSLKSRAKHPTHQGTFCGLQGMASASWELTSYMEGTEIRLFFFCLSYWSPPCRSTIWFMQYQNHQSDKFPHNSPV